MNMVTSRVVTYPQLLLCFQTSHALPTSLCRAGFYLSKISIRSEFICRFLAELPAQQGRDDRGQSMEWPRNPSYRGDCGQSLEWPRNPSHDNQLGSRILALLYGALLVLESRRQLALPVPENQSV